MNPPLAIRFRILLGGLLLTGCSATNSRGPLRLFSGLGRTPSSAARLALEEASLTRPPVSLDVQENDDPTERTVRFISGDEIDLENGESSLETLDASESAIGIPTVPLGESPLAFRLEGMSGATLDQVINQCLLADPVIRAGLEAINQSNADALTASLKPNPSLGVDQTLLPLTRPFTVDRQGGPPQLDVGLEYSIDWFLFGKRAAAMQSASMGVRVSEAEYSDLVRRRVLEAAIAYYDLLEAKALLGLARQDVENMQRIETITQRAVDNGGRPQVELSRIQLDRLRAEQGLRDAERARVAAIASLRALLGRTDTDPAFDISDSPTKDLAAEPFSIEDAFAMASTQRPDLIALRWKVQKACAETHVEYRAAYPEVSPRIGYTHQYQRKAIGFPDADSWGIGVGMTLPIYNRNQGNRARAASVVTQSHADLLAGEVELRAEIEQVTAQLRTAAANARAVADEQLKLAEQVRDSLNTAYQAGGRPLIDALDAQRNYRETYRLFITSRADYGRAVVQYNATLGSQILP